MSVRYTLKQSNPQLLKDSRFVSTLTFEHKNTGNFLFLFFKPDFSHTAVVRCHINDILYFVILFTGGNTFYLQVPLAFKASA